MSVFTVRDLTVGFTTGGETRAVVHGLDLAVEAGQTLALVGESGSGKSVSLLAATGLLDPARTHITGEANLVSRDGNQTDLVAASPAQLRRLRGHDVGFVFQDPQANLHPLKTIGRQVSEALNAHGRLPRPELRRRVLELLDEVGIKEPHHRVHDYPVHFSGGMRQRVMIAMAIAHNPALLIADEPTTALDVTVQAAILDLLARLQREHDMAMVLVSHDLGVVSDVADQVVVLQRGQVVERGSAEQICGDPREPYTQELLRAARPRVLRETSPDNGPVVVQAHNLVHDYDSAARVGRPAVRGVSFEVQRGEILGLVGESGSGKSTIGRIVSGLLQPSSGHVKLDGAEFAGPGRRRRFRSRPVVPAAQRRRVQVVFQDPYASLNPRHRIRDILAEPFRAHPDAVQGASLDAEVAALAQAVEIDLGLLSRRPGQLSGGQRQRVAIARALALRPDLLVADEAVSALDVTTRAQILDLFARLRAERGIAVLFISHDLGVVRALCDRVLVLSGGEVVESGRTVEVFDRPRHPYTRALVNSVPGRRGLLEPAALGEVASA